MMEDSTNDEFDDRALDRALGSLAMLGGALLGGCLFWLGGVWAWAVMTMILAAQFIWNGYKSPRFRDAFSSILSRESSEDRIVRAMDELALPNWRTMLTDPKADLAAEQELALDRAVDAVRAAEAAGRLGIDSRSDAEIKESIRTMWEEDYSDGREP